MSPPSIKVLFFTVKVVAKVEISFRCRIRRHWEESKEKFPYSMTLHRNVRSFGANNQVQGWEKQVFLTQPF